MTTVLLILLALVVAGAIAFFLMKKGKIEDKNGNNIPDVIEEKIEDVKEVVKVVKERVKRVVKVKVERVEVEADNVGVYS